VNKIRWEIKVFKMKMIKIWCHIKAMIKKIVYKIVFGRKLQMIDCQNLFCETDKYARIAHPDICGLNDRKRIKQQYVNRNLENIAFLIMAVL